VGGNQAKAPRERTRFHEWTHGTTKTPHHQIPPQDLLGSKGLFGGWPGGVVGGRGKGQVGRQGANRGTCKEKLRLGRNFN